MDESPIIIPGGIIEEGPEHLIIVPDDYEYPEPSPEFYPWPGDPNEKAVIGSGTLRLRANIGAEAGLGSSSNVKLNGSSAIRDLIGKAASAQTKMSEFYGASALAFDKATTQAQAGGGYAGYGESYYGGGSGNKNSWDISIGCRGGSGVSPDAYNWLWVDLSLKPNTTYRCDYDITLTRSGPSAAVYIGATSRNQSARGFNWVHESSWGNLRGTYVGGNSGPPYAYDVSWNEGGTMVNKGGGQTSTRNANWFNITTTSNSPYFCVGCRTRGNSNGNSGSGSITVHSLTLTEQ